MRLLVILIISYSHSDCNIMLFYSNSEHEGLNDLLTGMLVNAGYVATSLS